MEQGLERAMAGLKAFEDDQCRLPNASDKALGGVKAAIKRGEWFSFGIKSWSDFLEKMTLQSWQETRYTTT